MNVWLISIRLLATMTVLTGLIYPLAVTGFGAAFFPDKRQGSVVYCRERAVGSALLAQKFTAPVYFQPRPSQGDYATVSSAASNYGPLHEKLKEAYEARLAYWRERGLNNPPADLLFASGSGLDPHISAEAALAQVPLVAAARAYDEAAATKLRQLVVARTESSLIGPPRVNVLLLNMSLDGCF